MKFEQLRLTQFVLKFSQTRIRFILRLTLTARNYREMEIFAVDLALRPRTGKADIRCKPTREGFAVRSRYKIPVVGRQKLSR